MILSSWRITKQKHARTAFTGEGARLYGGRWNTPGTNIVYTAQSRALAILEMLVHLERENILKKYTLLEVSFDESLVEVLDTAALPPTWKDDPAPAEVKTLGDSWISGGTSAVLRVPSVIVPGESNFLLNPGHRDFRKLMVGKAEPYQFDPRLNAASR